MWQRRVATEYSVLSVRYAAVGRQAVLECMGPCGGGIRTPALYVYRVRYVPDLTPKIRQSYSYEHRLINLVPGHWLGSMLSHSSRISYYILMLHTSMPNPSCLVSRTSHPTSRPWGNNSTVGDDIHLQRSFSSPICLKIFYDLINNFLKRVHHITSILARLSRHRISTIRT